MRVLLKAPHGSLAHFALAPGQTSRAVAHHTIDEIWYFLSGRGEMWRKLGDQEETVTVEAGVCLTLPRGTHFQTRALGAETLAAIGITLPPWPGDDEAYAVEPHWPVTVES